MKRLLLVALLVPLAAAHTDAGPVARSLAAFAHDACAYMAAHPAPKTGNEFYYSPEPRLASHFGRIVKASSRDDTGFRHYTLAVPQFPGWEVDFLGREIKLEIPLAQQPRLDELTQLLGTPKHGKPGCSAILQPHVGPEPPPPPPPPDHTGVLELDRPAGWPRCEMSIKTEERDSQQFVTSFFLSARD
jgi:hypothetical protein